MALNMKDWVDLMPAPTKAPTAMKMQTGVDAYNAAIDAGAKINPTGVLGTKAPVRVDTPGFTRTDYGGTSVVQASGGSGQNPGGGFQWSDLIKSLGPLGFSNKEIIEAGRVNAAMRSAGASEVAAGGAAYLDRMRGSVLPQTTMADIAEANARVGKLGADTAAVRESTRLLPSITASEIGLRGSQTLLNRSNAAGIDASTAASRRPVTQEDVDYARALWGADTRPPGGSPVERLYNRMFRLSE